MDQQGSNKDSIGFCRLTSLYKKYTDIEKHCDST